VESSWRLGRSEQFGGPFERKPRERAEKKPAVLGRGPWTCPRAIGNRAGAPHKLASGVLLKKLQQGLLEKQQRRRDFAR
jgi:hypothetical protein